MMMANPEWSWAPLAAVAFWMAFFAMGAIILRHVPSERPRTDLRRPSQAAGRQRARPNRVGRR